LTTFAAAQPQRMSVEDRVKILTDSLQLSADQAKKITTILEDQREEMSTLRDQNKGDRDAMRSAMQDAMKKSDEKIKAVLTEEQAKHYDAMQKAHRMNMGRRARGGGQ